MSNSTLAIIFIFILFMFFSAIMSGYMIMISQTTRERVAWVILGVFCATIAFSLSDGLWEQCPDVAVQARCPK